MKAICSFILALAVSSAGAQIRPVESLPIAVNYSKTIHLVFPSAVKYNQAVTDFVAVDNPESVPNILRIKANRKSFSKQTTGLLAGYFAATETAGRMPALPPRTTAFGEPIPFTASIESVVSLSNNLRKREILLFKLS